MMTDLIFFALLSVLFLLTLRRRYDCRRDDQPVDDLLAAITDLRSTLEADMSAEADAVRAALDVLEPKVVAFIAAHAANNGLAAELAADKAALVDAQARIAALTAQLDAVPVA